MERKGGFEDSRAAYHRQDIFDTRVTHYGVHCAKLGGTTIDTIINMHNPHCPAGKWEA